MAIPYVTFMKHAEKVTKTASASRPILKGVFHSDDGSLIVTDSHRIYFAKNAHTNGAESVIDPKTGANIDGNYPDCSRLIPDKSNVKYSVKVPVKESLDAFTALLKASQINGKGSELVFTEEAEYGTMKFSVDNSPMEASYNAGRVNGSFEKVTFNLTFIVDALKLLKDVGAIDTEIRFYGAFRPFTLTTGSDDEILALLLPIRTSN
ncbi:hypothetical protein HYI36_20190 [Bacillus sp. Gen3]|nr:hypothetical protein [Bacillus sp. Gen3]